MTEPDEGMLPRIEPIELDVRGKTRVFDIMDGDLPDWIAAHHLTADGYPYDTKLPSKRYKRELHALQVEFVKLQLWMRDANERVIAIFEGRDAAGKGGTIFALRRYMNPRLARNVALAKPSEVEKGQWYFQRYVTHFPAHGEFVTFDRSWYNRAVVEPVMGFCTPEQAERFLEVVPAFEATLVDDGIHLFKFWLNISRETQLKRFHARVHDPLKVWKFSPIDIAGMARWDDYTAARDRMLARTHTVRAPWTIVRANDRRRARLAAMRRILLAIPYAGRNLEAIGKVDDGIVLHDPAEITGL